MDTKNKFTFEVRDHYNYIEKIDLSLPFDSWQDNCTKQVGIYIRYENITAAYLELLIFDCKNILNDGQNIFMLADGESGHAQEGIEILDKLGYIDRDLFDLGLHDEALETNAKIHINHIAVKEEFRGKGLAKWLLSNLFQIIRLNYNMFPDAVSVKLFPQKIQFDRYTPTFDTGLPESEFKPMFEIMQKLFTSSGFVRYKETDFFVKDILKDYK